MSSIFFRTAIIYALLSVSMRAMGKRQIGELEVGELISALLISEICSIPIDDPDIPLLNAFIPVIFIVSLEIIISFYKNKSSKLKKVLDGEPTYLIKNGRINQNALRENRISIEEFYTSIRQNGYGAISEIGTCILEANGKISVLPPKRKEERIIISDGEKRTEEMKAVGISENELQRILGKKRAEDIFLLTADHDGITNIIIKEEKN